MKANEKSVAFFFSTSIIQQNTWFFSKPRKKS